MKTGGFPRAFRSFLRKQAYSNLSFVMAGLVPAIHVLAARTWMPGTTPGMTG